MKEKINFIKCEQLSNKELQEVKGGCALLVLALVAFDIAVVGMAISGSFMAGYNKARADN
jgi:lactobin A/cerein 7B family class IIb bacteriocin